MYKFDKHGSPESSPKYFPKLGLYKASNVTFDPNTNVALSYGYWKFVKVINNELVFNSYRYSVTTARHQRRIRRLLVELGLEINVEIECPKGLDDLVSSLRFYSQQIADLETAIAKPRSQKAKNAERRAEIDTLQHKIKIVRRLMKATGETVKIERVNKVYHE
jgi:hypothetical protein